MTQNMQLSRTLTHTGVGDSCTDLNSQYSWSRSAVERIAHFGSHAEKSAEFGRLTLQLAKEREGVKNNTEYNRIFGDPPTQMTSHFSFTVYSVLRNGPER